MISWQFWANLDSIDQDFSLGIRTISKTFIWFHAIWNQKRGNWVYRKFVYIELRSFINSSMVYCDLLSIALMSMQSASAYFFRQELSVSWTDWQLYQKERRSPMLPHEVHHCGVKIYGGHIIFSFFGGFHFASAGGKVKDAGKYMFIFAFRHQYSCWECWVGYRWTFWQWLVKVNILI